MAKPGGRGRDHGLAAGDRAGEADAGDTSIGHQARSVRVREVQVLEHASRHARGCEGFEKTLGAQRRLVRVLEHHRVTRDQRRQHRVDRGQIGIIPGRHDDHHAQRHALDLAAEAGLVAGLHRGQRLGRHVQHVARALLEAADFTGRMTQRASHLPGDFGGDVLAPDDEGIHCAPQQLAACGQRQTSATRLARAARSRAHARYRAVLCSGRSTYTRPSTGLMVLSVSVMKGSQMISK